MLHFGLNNATHVSSLCVTWPSGESRKIRNLPANRIWTLYPDGKLGDTDQNGQLDLRDFVKLLKWRSGDLVGNLVPGREMFDFDGDSDIDAVDFKQFHDRFPRPLPDCNKNGIDDLSEIFFDPSKDKNQDGVPDDCKS